MIAAIIGFVAGVCRARNRVVTIGRGTSHTTHHCITRLETVAEQAVRAQIVILDVRTTIRARITEIIGARHVVIAIERRTIHAPEHRIAGLDAIAIHAIVAQHVIGHVRT